MKLAVNLKGNQNKKSLGFVLYHFLFPYIPQGIPIDLENFS